MPVEPYGFRTQSPLKRSDSRCSSTGTTVYGSPPPDLKALSPIPLKVDMKHQLPSNQTAPIPLHLATSTATSVITQSLNLIGNTFAPVQQQSKNEAAATAAGAEPDGAARVFDLEDDVLAHNFYTEELRKWTEESRNSRPIPTNPSSQSNSKPTVPPLDLTELIKAKQLQGVQTPPDSPRKIKRDEEKEDNRLETDIKRHMKLHVFGQFSTDNGTPIDGETYTISKNELTFENIEDDALLKHNCTYKENLTINEKQVSGFFQQTSPDYKHHKFELISGIDYTIHAPNATISGPLTKEGNFVSNHSYSKSFTMHNYDITIQFEYSNNNEYEGQITITRPSSDKTKLYIYDVYINNKEIDPARSTTRTFLRHKQEKSRNSPLDKKDLYFVKKILALK
jgi:hypothetical protein